MQPDLSRCGGFTVARKIVHMAELHNRLCIPHAWLSDLLTAASLHLNAFMRRSVFQEFNVTSGPLSRELCKNPIQLEDGFLRVPQVRAWAWKWTKRQSKSTGWSEPWTESKARLRL